MYSLNWQFPAKFNNTTQQRIKPSSKLSKCAEGFAGGSQIESTFRCGPWSLAGSNMKVATGSHMQFEAYNGAVVLKSLDVSAHVPPESTL